MKANYISPSVESFPIQGGQLVCSSPTGATTDSFVINDEILWTLFD